MIIYCPSCKKESKITRAIKDAIVIDAAVYGVRKMECICSPCDNPTTLGQETYFIVCAHEDKL